MGIVVIIIVGAFIALMCVVLVIAQARVFGALAIDAVRRLWRDRPRRI